MNAKKGSDGTVDTFDEVWEPGMRVAFNIGQGIEYGLYVQRLPAPEVEGHHHQVISEKHGRMVFPDGRLVGSIPDETLATLEDELSDENREWLMGYGLPVRNLIGAFDKRGREIERLRSDLRDLLVDLRENHYSELKGCGLFCSLASREGIKL